MLAAHTHNFLTPILAPCRVATAAGLKTAWSDKAIQYSFVAGPGNPLDLSDRITEFRPYSIDYLVRCFLVSISLVHCQGVDISQNSTLSEI